MPEPFIAKQRLDREAVRRSFSAAADSYDAFAFLQREVGTRMLERLDYIRAEPKVIVDLGAGTGEHTAALAKRYPRARTYGLDLAEPMLKKMRKRSSWRRPIRPLCADIQALPFADNSVDLIFSSLAMQWCEALQTTFTEFRRVLRPGGFVLFSTFGPDTLTELRQSWAMVDEREHVHNFIDMHIIGDAMMQAGLAEPVMDVENLTLTYKSVYDLMRELKGIGAHNVAHGRQRGLTGRKRLQAFEQAYEKFRCDGVVPASYEVVYGHAWAPVNAQLASVSIESLQRK
ncbi:malonyl-ACP O-methyltransferase BioC [Sulfuriflexus mobilis]|uniref:malonyl-ACP O-methyltransferase BioC n=1 Tax=Sulfuriflexus mobilis TaxID=1811807 RepID=UPI000F82142D|nr:malonyl-ACP O-methyltransferase BioC [Sulfuriflexus mobilis]